MQVCHSCVMSVYHMCDRQSLSCKEEDFDSFHWLLSMLSLLVVFSLLVLFFSVPRFLCFLCFLAFIHLCCCLFVCLLFACLNSSSLRWICLTRFLKRSCKPVPPLIPLCNVAHIISSLYLLTSSLVRLPLPRHLLLMSLVRCLVLLVCCLFLQQFSMKLVRTSSGSFVAIPSVVISGRCNIKSLLSCWDRQINIENSLSPTPKRSQSNSQQQHPQSQPRLRLDHQNGGHSSCLAPEGIKWSVYRPTDETREEENRFPYALLDFLSLCCLHCL